jgi:hypothetical protein
MLKQMLLYLSDLVAAQMNKLSAFFAFAVKTDILAAVTFRLGIFETGGTVGVNSIFSQYSLADKTLQLTVNS